MEIKFSEISHDLETSKSTAEYYKNELKECREKHKTLLKLFTKTQAEFEVMKNPSDDPESAQSIELKGLNLKIEGLELINKKLNESVVNSNRVIKQIEIICIQEIEKIQENLKSFVHNLARHKDRYNQDLNNSNCKLW